MVHTRVYSLQDRNGYEGEEEGLHWYSCHMQGESFEAIAADIEENEAGTPEWMKTQEFYIFPHDICHEPNYFELKKWTQGGREARLKSFSQTHAVVENVLGVVGAGGGEECPFYSIMEINLMRPHCRLDKDQDRGLVQRCVLLDSRVVMELNDTVKLVAYTMQVKKGEVFGCGDDRYIVTADNRLLCGPKQNFVFEYPMVKEMLGKCFQDEDELYQYMDSLPHSFLRRPKYDNRNIQYKYNGVWKPFPVKCVRSYFTGVSCR